MLRKLVVMAAIMTDEAAENNRKISKFWTQVKII